MAKNISITIKERNNIKIFSPRDLIISTEQRKKRKAKYARYKIFRLAQNLITTQYERKGEGEKRKKRNEEIFKKICSNPEKEKEAQTIEIQNSQSRGYPPSIRESSSSQPRANLSEHSRDRIFLSSMLSIIALHRYVYVYIYMSYSSIYIHTFLNEFI